MSRRGDQAGGGGGVGLEGTEGGGSERGRGEGRPRDT